MTKTICDICGKDVPRSMPAKHKTTDGCVYELGNYSLYDRGKRMDMCFDCKIEFVKWLNERKEAVEEVVIPKADYEKLLKTDRLNRLTDLQSEIEELDSRAGYDGEGMPTFSTDYIRKKKVNELIQQKINELKEGKDGSNNT